ncbi:uncharacterized protein MONOS_8952 [Monocercomonoides exilis]|uniref:uncharacterized protein n=1 Tax=Monocercomonoides exilis TaxID=2049356 RepID=UPI00355A3E78|nr:hypothetical protein MONOS_8952 [Monocercomonoides exilis]
MKTSSSKRSKTSASSSDAKWDVFEKQFTLKQASFTEQAQQNEEVEIDSAALADMQIFDWAVNKRLRKGKEDEGVFILSGNQLSPISPPMTQSQEGNGNGTGRLSALPLSASLSWELSADNPTSPFASEATTSFFEELKRREDENASTNVQVQVQKVGGNENFIQSEESSNHPKDIVIQITQPATEESESEGSKQSSEEEKPLKATTHILDYPKNPLIRTGTVPAMHNASTTFLSSHSEVSVVRTIPSPLSMRNGCGVNESGGGKPTQKEFDSSPQLVYCVDSEPEKEFNVELKKTLEQRENEEQGVFLTTYACSSYSTSSSFSTSSSSSSSSCFSPVFNHSSSQNVINDSPNCQQCKQQSSLLNGLLSPKRDRLKESKFPLLKLSRSQMSLLPSIFRFNTSYSSPPLSPQSPVLLPNSTNIFGTSGLLKGKNFSRNETDMLSPTGFLPPPHHSPPIHSVSEAQLSAMFPSLHPCSPESSPQREQHLSSRSEHRPPLLHPTCQFSSMKKLPQNSFDSSGGILFGSVGAALPRLPSSAALTDYHSKEIEQKGESEAKGKNSNVFAVGANGIIRLTPEKCNALMPMQIASPPIHSPSVFSSSASAFSRYVPADFQQKGFALLGMQKISSREEMQQNENNSFQESVPSSSPALSSPHFGSIGSLSPGAFAGISACAKNNNNVNANSKIVNQSPHRFDSKPEESDASTSTNTSGKTSTERE